MIKLKNILTETTLANDTDFRSMVKTWEGPGPVDGNNNHLAYDDARPNVPAKPGQRIEGTLTIGYGTTATVLPTLKPGLKISAQKAEDLLTKGIIEHEAKARQLVPKYDTYPKYVQGAILNAIYRGDLGPKTAAAMNAGKWADAATMYLQHHNYTNPGKFTGVVNRMKSNADAFAKYAKELATKKPTKSAKSKPTGVDWMDNAIASGYYTVKPGDQLLKIALDHGLTLDYIMNLNDLTHSGDIQPGDKLALR
jgi:GH24 family phage-related lysozyme (muramidase)